MTTKALGKIVAERFALVEALRLKNVEMLAAMRAHDVAMEQSDLPTRDRVKSLTVFNGHAGAVPRRLPVTNTAFQTAASQFDRVLSQLAKESPLVKRRSRSLNEGRIGESRLVKTTRMARETRTDG